MEIIVGIPRALLYHHYNRLWEEFFNLLNIKIAISPSTNKQILNLGVNATVDESCLPVKIFFGHCAILVEQVDYIFLPRMVSGKKREYFCPKLMGIPDMAIQCLPNLPKLIAPTINLTKSNNRLYPALLEIGKILGRKKSEVIKAYNYAFKSWKNARQEKVRETSVIPEQTNSETNRLKIAVLGHSYNLYDNYMNINLISRLESLEVEVITPENIPNWAINKGIFTLNKPMYWSLGRRIIGSAQYYLQHPNCLDGIVLVVAFGCGPDSLVGELIERNLRKTNTIPLLLLTLDEHSGEAGLVTRIEAFIDLIRRRKQVG